jgi:4-methylaminobutanoate oxidase (formaldehyde-forming)
MSVPVLPTRARVVVIGGAIIGTSVAYHLAHMDESSAIPVVAGTSLVGAVNSVRAVASFDVRRAASRRSFPLSSSSWPHR